VAGEKSRYPECAGVGNQHIANALKTDARGRLNTVLMTSVLLGGALAVLALAIRAAAVA
jgi:hypothetical protein